MFIYLCLIAKLDANAQTYWDDYPISYVVENNGTQSRLMVSTYDSLMQITITDSTSWSDGYYFLSNNYGKLCYSLWLNPNLQTGVAGIIVYDFVIHEFSNLELTEPNMTASKHVNFAAGPMWVRYGVETEFPGSSFALDYFHYRYSLATHEWKHSMGPLREYSQTPILWTMDVSSYSNWQYRISYVNGDADFHYYDPYYGRFEFFLSDCAFGNSNVDEEEICVDSGCLTDFIIQQHNAETGSWHSPFPDYTSAVVQHGIGLAQYDDNSTVANYIFALDLGINDVIIEEIGNPDFQIIKIEDRVAAYNVLSNGTNPMIYFLVHDPIQHAWVKDSAITSSNVTINIVNGTVYWSDATGSYIRGYDVTSGWGNYTTPLFMYFHLTDFSTQNGVPMVHVRNYSIGAEKFYFDMGDGTVTGFRDNFYRLYDESGTFNICMYDSSGQQSVCQSVTFNTCTVPGYIQASSDSICQGDSVVLNLVAHLGNIQWQYSYDQINWLDVTGVGFDSVVYVVSPIRTTYYRAQVTNNNCLTLTTVQKQIKVRVFSGFISNIPTTACIGSRVHFVATECAGILGWQKNEGSGWQAVINGNHPTCYDTIYANTDYRLIATAATPGCPNDTSQVISMIAQAGGIVNPVSPLSICGSDSVNLQVSGTGTFLWYSSNSPISAIIDTGATLNAYIPASTTYFVKALDGTIESPGLQDTIAGNTTTFPGGNLGLRIKSLVPGSIQSIKLYPKSLGYFSVVLNGEPGFSAYSEVYHVTSTSSPFIIQLDVQLNAMKEYDLQIIGPLQFEIVNSGFNYPINNPGSGFSILGYVLNKEFYTDSSHYNIFDIEFLSGCSSGLTPFPVNVVQPFTSNLTAAGPTTFCAGSSVTLNAAPSGGFTYAWFKNNVLLTSAITSSYTATLPGQYKVIMTSGACSDTSNTISVFVPCLRTLSSAERMAENDPGTVFFNPRSSKLEFTFMSTRKFSNHFQINDVSGRTIMKRDLYDGLGENSVEVDVSHLAKGVYILKWEHEGIVSFLKWAQ